MKPKRGETTGCYESASKVSGGHETTEAGSGLVRAEAGERAWEEGILMP